MPMAGGHRAVRFSFQVGAARGPGDCKVGCGFDEIRPVIGGRDGPVWMRLAPVNQGRLGDVMGGPHNQMQGQVTKDWPQEVRQGRRRGKRRGGRGRGSSFGGRMFVSLPVIL